MAMGDRPTDRNLRAFGSGNLTPEEEFAIRSAGGKASQEAKKKKKAMAELLQLYSDLPINDNRKKNRLKKLGIEESDLTQKALVADAIMRGAQGGNFYLIQLYLESIGEMGQGATGKENNLLSAIVGNTAEEVDVSDLPEVQQEAEPDADVVE